MIRLMRYRRSMIQGGVGVGKGRCGETADMFALYMLGKVLALNWPVLVRAGGGISSRHAWLWAASEVSRENCQRLAGGARLEQSTVLTSDLARIGDWLATLSCPV